MANGKREFEIKINGITESIDGATKLVDVLNQIENKEKTVTVETEKGNKARKEKKQALTDEEKAQKKLEEIRRKAELAEGDLNKQIIAANRELRERTRAATLDVQVQNTSVNSIEGMRAQLNLLRNEWTKTDVGSERFAELTEEVANLTAKLKEAEAATGDFRRNVGNYESALNGLEGGIGGLEERLNGLSSSLESSTSLGNGLANTFMLGAGVLGLFGSQSEDTAKAMENVQKILGLLSIAQALNNNLIKSGTLLKIKDALAEKARAVQTALSTVATNASSVSLKLFSKALVATGVGAFVVLLGLLIANFDKIKGAVLETFPALKDFGGYLDKFKAIAAGVGNALITYILTPFRVIGAVVKKVMEGDIKGAFVDGFEEVKKGFKVVENYQKGFEEQTIKNQENANKERAKLRAEELDNLIKDNEAKAGSDWKYSEEGKKAYADLFAAKRIMYAGDIEAMRELQREEWKHLADIQKHTDEEVKKRREAGQRVADARKQALDSYKKALESFQSETHKLELANEQKRIDLAKDTAEKLIATTKDELALRKLAIEDSYSKQNAINKKLAEDEKKAVEKTYDELIASAKKAGQDTLALEAEKQERLKQLEESAAITELTLLNEKNKKFKEEEEKRQKDLLDIQKRWADLSLKEVENQYRDIQDLREKLLVREQNGLQLIDVEATRKNLEETEKALNDYIGKLQAAKEKLKAVHEENLKTLKKGTPEYEEELNRYADAEYSLNKKIEKANKDKVDITKQSASLVQSYWQDMFSKIAEIANQVADGIGNIMGAVSAVYQSQLDELNEKYDEISERYDEVEKKREESAERIKDFEQQIQEAQGGTALALREQLAREMQAKAELDREEKRLAKEKEKREAEMAKKEKQIKKADLITSIAVATANVAEAVTKMLTAGPIIGQILAGIAAATGAVQIGVMTRQLAKMEDGGLLAGPSHASGGMRIQGTNIEVEGGEYVVNKRSTARNQQLIEYINNSTETVTARDIANLQGIPIGNYNNTPDVQVRDTYTTQDKILEAIEGINFRPVVSVKDINDVQNNVVDVTDIAGID